jgi:hypothetical protein
MNRGRLAADTASIDPWTIRRLKQGAYVQHQPASTPLTIDYGSFIRRTHHVRHFSTHELEGRCDIQSPRRRRDMSTWMENMVLRICNSL